MEKLLEAQPFLLGARFTDADLRLFPTVARYDAVYNSFFRCTRRRLAADCPATQAWMHRVWALPAQGQLRVRLCCASISTLDPLQLWYCYAVKRILRWSASEKGEMFGVSASTTFPSAHGRLKMKTWCVRAGL